MQEKRSLARSLCSDLVKLEWKDQRGRMQQISAVLEDICPQGACLQVERPLPIDVAIQVSHDDDWEVTCRTVYCVFREIGYFVGVVFDAGTRWNPGDYKTRHLLDLTKLTSKETAVN